MAKDIDQVAATKANLELMLQENAQLCTYFDKVIKRLSELETLEPTEKRTQFRAMEEQGDLKFNGVDIRHFAHAAPARPLSPPEFLVRTRRRLRNTNTLIEEFLKRDIFKEGAQLRDELDSLTYNIVNATNQQEVVEFKEKVEKLRDSASLRTTRRSSGNTSNAILKSEPRRTSLAQRNRPKKTSKTSRNGVKT